MNFSSNKPSPNLPKSRNSSKSISIKSSNTASLSTFDKQSLNSSNLPYKSIIPSSIVCSKNSLNSDIVGDRNLKDNNTVKSLSMIDATEKVTLRENKNQTLRPASLSAAGARNLNRNFQESVDELLKLCDQVNFEVEQCIENQGFNKAETMDPVEGDMFKRKVCQYNKPKQSTHEFDLDKITNDIYNKEFEETKNTTKSSSSICHTSLGSRSSLSLKIKV